MRWRPAELALVDPSLSEQFGIVLGAVSAFITAIGGVAIWRGRRETKGGEGPSQIAVLKAALDRVAIAVEANSEHTAKSNEQMSQNLSHVEGIGKNTTEMTQIGHRVEIRLAELGARIGGRDG